MKEFKNSALNYSPLKKAISVCLLNIDRKINHLEPDVSDEEKNFIIDCVTDEERPEYNRWVACYNTYRNVASLFGLCYGEYNADAYRLLGDLIKWKCYMQESEHLNILLNAARKTSDPENYDKIMGTLGLMGLEDASFVVENGIVKTLVNEDCKLYSSIKEGVAAVTASLGALKSFIQALEEFTEKNECSVMMPDSLREGIRDSKQDRAQKVDKRFSREILDHRIEMGEDITEEDKFFAVFPYYSGTPADPVYLELWRSRIKELSAYEDL